MFPNKIKWIFYSQILFRCIVAKHSSCLMTKISGFSTFPPKNFNFFFILKIVHYSLKQFFCGGKAEKLLNESREVYGLWKAKT